MDTPAPLYQRLTELCRRQGECLAREDFDAAERLLDEQDALLRRAAEAWAAGAWSEEEREQILAAAFSALAAEQETAALLMRQLDALRDRLCRVDGGRAAVRCYRPSAHIPTVDRYS